MQSPCDPPKFDERDWSKFDFSRFHLDGINLEATAAAIAGLSQRLLTSPEWRQNFRAALPDLKEQLLNVHREAAKDLTAEREVVAQDFDRRVADAQSRSESLARAVETAAAPPVVAVTPDTYNVAIKVAASSNRLGLPGMTVQLMDPRNPEKALVEAVTDRDGNAILALPSAAEKELDTLHTALQVVGPSGKPLQMLKDGACIRFNQTETRLISLPDSPEIQTSKAAALENRSLRDAQIQTISRQIDFLKQERESRLRTLDCRVQQNQAIIDAFQPPPGPDTTNPGAPPPAAAAELGHPPSKLSKGRKKP